jgi:hypothetical protein
MAAALSQYDYIFAITTIFAFLDAWNIGTRSYPLALGLFGCLGRLIVAKCAERSAPCAETTNRFKSKT